ncbi:hypothetical protein LCGC14_1073070 [marine sediment metagenome]|uniref:Uncharacterized protein n=1 Tax=marine sediment metagenome TaxID=412755 RepID=A0A0F9QNH4_9ZZZZ
MKKKIGNIILCFSIVIGGFGLMLLVMQSIRWF